MMTSPRSLSLPPLLAACLLACFAGAAHAQTEAPSFSLGNWFDAPSWLDDAGKPLQWGRWELTPAFSYGFSHIEGQPGQALGSATSTQSHRLSPSVNGRYGDQWSFGYSPSWTFYSSGRYSEKVNHRANVAGNFRASTVSFGVTGTFTKSDDVELERGAQTNQTTWSTGLQGYVPINRQLGVQGSTRYSDRDSSRLSESQSWQHSASLSAQVMPKVSSSLGASYGTTDINPGFSQKSTSYFLSGNWSLARKISASGSIGHSERKVDAPGATKTSGLTYDGSIRYRPFAHTSVDVGLSKDFGGSIVGSRVTETERVSISLGQRLFGRFQLGLGYSTGTTKYLNPLDPTTRSDDTERYTVSLGTSLSQRLKLRASYSDVQNKSSLSGFGVDSQRYGFTLTYSY